MDRPSGPTRPAGPPPALEPIPEVVPSRAVLTELARGFLLLHDRDPTRASEFARTFLREQVGRTPTGSERPHLPAVRRGSSVWGDEEF